MNKKQAFFVLFVCFSLIFSCIFYILYTNNSKIKNNKNIEKIASEQSQIFIKKAENLTFSNEQVYFSFLKQNENYYEDTYTVTAYCSCRKCCGRWADNRPQDKNGNAIVYGASGAILWSGYSVASPLPFGTIIEIDGYKYEVQDRTSKSIANYYGNKIIDIYFNNHEEAINWGKQEKVVKIYE